ncbi:MAG: ornithine cyclodeaminase family protein [Anaerolineae bacterium]|nr:ornithine cyclodeaminase family protein [Anaerolineae bacterium]
MDILILNSADVRRLLPMDACIDAMAEAFMALRRGEALNPLRLVMMLPDQRSVLAVMPSYLKDSMGVKVISVMPGNHGTPYDSHNGAVLLFEAVHGQPLAMIEAGAITAIRTAAVSGLATRLLAREDAGDLAILGVGVQARTHLEAMQSVRKLHRVRVWSRNLDRARIFAEREAAKYGLTIEVMPTVQVAVAGADLICTTTAAREPILMGEWLAPGVHLNVVGASLRTTREVDTAAMVKSRLYVDRRESTLNEAGDFLIPKSEGTVDDSHIQGELGEVLLGQVKGRQSAAEITLFKSLGLAVEDLASAQLIYAQAVEQGIGIKVPFGDHEAD